MADSQTIVDQIRAFTSAADQTNSPHLADLANEYATLCNEANARLRRCTDYLRRGLRAEAIHLAEEHPALLEVISTLDLPEAPQWANVCAMYELTRPTPLLIEAAHELNEAYAAVEPIKVLLNRHRRLAIERAPLVERIGVMRELATADKSSTYWEEDLRTFEAARLKQCKIEAASAYKVKDRAGLSKLLAEITAQGWRVEVPADLRASVQKADDSLGQEQATRLIRQKLPDLDLAYGMMDLNAVSQVVAQIHKLAADGKLTLTPDIAEKVDPADQWVKQQNARAARQAEINDAVETLAVALQSAIPSPRLRSLEAEIVELGGEVPDDLRQQVLAVAAREKAEKEKGKKQWMMIGVAGAAVLAIAAGVVFFLVSRDQRGRDAFKTLSSHYDVGDLAAAQDDLKRFAVDSPYVLDREDISKLEKRITDDAKAEETRKATFASKTALVASAIADASKTGLFTDSVWKPASTENAEAGKLAKTPYEKAAVRDLDQRITSAREAIRKNQDGSFRSTADALSSKFDSFQRSYDSGTLVSANADFQAALKQSAELIGNIPAGEQFAGARDQAKSVYLKYTSIAGAAELRLNEQNELDNIKRSTGSSSELQGALRRYVELCPGTDRARRFKTILTSTKGWLAAEDGSKLILSWGGDFRPDAAAVAKRLDAVSTHLSKYANSPWSRTLVDYSGYLKACLAATSADGPWKTKFATELEDKIYGEIKYIRSQTDGKSYYLPSDVQLQRSIVNGSLLGTEVRYLTNPNDLAADGTGKATKIAKLKPEQFKGDPGPSPQSVLSKKLLKIVKTPAGDWNTIGFDIISSIDESKEVDPILQVRLLTRTLEAMKVSSWGQEDTITASLKSLAAINPDELAWMDPEDLDAIKARSSANKLVEGQLSTLKKSRTAAESAAKQMLVRLNSSFVSKGVLLKSGSSWTIAATGKSTDGQRALIAGDNGWVPVGTCRDGAFAVDLKSSDESFDGSMVFIFPATADIVTADSKSN